jgi:hypothetical protein
MSTCLLRGFVVTFLTALFFGLWLPAQTVAIDPGVRGGPPGAGLSLMGLSGQEIALWDDAQAIFLSKFAVRSTGQQPGGLGPVFNLDSCAGCHAQPSIGGSSPPVNPEVGVANFLGATNQVPFFITGNGPVRIARFQYASDGTYSGAVQPLFTITGRTDAASCSIAQPNFNAAAAAGNLSYRIPTPLFGLGLVESIPDSAILQNKNSNLGTRQALGISGHENRNSGDGTITRFGWKAQDKSLLLFSAEALNLEIGVTNDLFPQKHDETPGCVFNPLPEDTNGTSAGLDEQPTLLTASPLASNFQFFMRFLAPPSPGPGEPGLQGLFDQIGCNLCHTPVLTTGTSSHPALSNQPVNLYSDLLLHHMGPGLADGIVQGNAAGDEFRTAPLWGIGQRIFFLHDGRTSDLLGAIEAHASAAGPPGRAPLPTSLANPVATGKERYAASEANQVIAKFNALSNDQKQQILVFLRSL